MSPVCAGCVWKNCKIWRNRVDCTTCCERNVSTWPDLSWHRRMGLSIVCHGCDSFRRHQLIPLRAQRCALRVNLCINWKSTSRLVSKMQWLRRVRWICWPLPCPTSIVTSVTTTAADPWFAAITLLRFRPNRRPLAFNWKEVNQPKVWIHLPFECTYPLLLPVPAQKMWPHFSSSRESFFFFRNCITFLETLGPANGQFSRLCTKSLRNCSSYYLNHCVNIER